MMLSPKAISLIGAGKMSHLNGTASINGGSSSAGARSILGSFHEGGEVTEDGAYELEAGEKVVPADKKKKGRDSEYRKVYLGRKKKK